MSAPQAPRDFWLLGLCASRFLITLIQMVYAASLPLLRPSWGMSATEAGSIATGTAAASCWWPSDMTLRDAARPWAG